MRIVQNTLGRCLEPVTCERCIGGGEAIYVVSSDVIHMRVCAVCAEEARKLGLTVTSNREARERSTAAVAKLGFQMKLGKVLGAITACLAVCAIYSYARMFRNCET